MNIRALLPFALLCSTLALSACGNKGPLLPPPAPDDDEWPAEPVDGQDATGEEDAGDPKGIDGDGFDDADADADTDADPDIDDEGADPADSAGDDGDGDA